jgi:hypothetical protein
MTDQVGARKDTTKSIELLNKVKQSNVSTVSHILVSIKQLRHNISQSWMIALELNLQRCLKTTYENKRIYILDCCFQRAQRWRWLGSLARKSSIYLILEDQS